MSEAKIILPALTSNQLLILWLILISAAYFLWRAHSRRPAAPRAAVGSEHD